jgi:hypothetical protein
MGCGNEKNESYRHCWAPDPTAATAGQAARLTGVRGGRWRQTLAAVFAMPHPAIPDPAVQGPRPRIHAEQPLTEQGQVE